MAYAFNDDMSKAQLVRKRYYLKTSFTVAAGGYADADFDFDSDKSQCLGIVGICIDTATSSRDKFHLAPNWYVVEGKIGEPNVTWTSIRVYNDGTSTITVRGLDRGQYSFVDVLEAK